MNTELKLVVINDKIPKHTLYVVQIGTAYRSFDTKEDAELLAEVLHRSEHRNVTIREICC